MSRASKGAPPHPLLSFSFAGNTIATPAVKRLVSGATGKRQRRPAAKSAAAAAEAAAAESRKEKEEEEEEDGGESTGPSKPSKRCVGASVRDKGMCGAFKRTMLMITATYYLAGCAWSRACRSRQRYWPRPQATS